MGQGRSRIDQKWETSTLRGIPNKDFGILLGLGVTEWGPEEATTVTSFDDFKRKYGGFLSAYDLPLQVYLFFKLGGSKAIIKRIFHYLNHTSAIAPLTAAKGTATLFTAVTGYGAQATLTVTGLYYGALALTVKVIAASNGSLEHFDLLVYRPDQTQPVEWYRNLTMDATATRYAIDIVNTSVEMSDYIRLTDLAASGSSTERRPINLASPTSLTGGNDGLTALAAADYQGGPAGRTGLYGFNLVNEGNILIVPDGTSTTVQNSATAYCEGTSTGQKQEKVIFIPDVPESLSYTSAINHVVALTASRARTGLDWPRIRISNPDKAVYGQTVQTITCGVSGCKAGLIASNSQRYQQKMAVNPSNEIYGFIREAVGLEGLDNKHEVLDPAVQDYVTDYGINPVLVGKRGTDGVYGVWFNDCQSGETVGSGELVSVGNQMLTSHLRYRYETFLERHRTQGNTEDRRQAIEDAISTDLKYWTSLACFASQNAEEAFYVNADVAGENLNNPLVQQQQKLKVKIGLAYADPARFIDLIFTRDNRAVESYLQQSAAASGNPAA